MKLRFDVDQAEALRRGIDCPKSIVTIEVNPAELSQEERNLIADRMDGIDVCVLGDSGQQMRSMSKLGYPRRIVAELPTFEALMDAIRENEKGVNRDSV